MLAYLGNENDGCDHHGYEPLTKWDDPLNSFCYLNLFDVYWDTILNDSVNIGHSDAHVDQ